MAEEEPMERRVVGVLLVDELGRILLQLRDGQAPVSPNKWSLVGGGVEPGEQPEAAARRELLEETGLRVEGPLTPFWQGRLPASSRPDAVAEWWVYCARTHARPEDVVVGEGEAMEFVAPERAPSLDFGANSGYFVRLFLASPEYRRLAGADEAHR